MHKLVAIACRVSRDVNNSARPAKFAVTRASAQTIAIIAKRGRVKMWFRDSRRRKLPLMFASCLFFGWMLWSISCRANLTGENLISLSRIQKSEKQMQKEAWREISYRYIANTIPFFSRRYNFIRAIMIIFIIVILFSPLVAAITKKDMLFIY